MLRRPASARRTLRSPTRRRFTNALLGRSPGDRDRPRVVRNPGLPLFPRRPPARRALSPPRSRRRLALATGTAGLALLVAGGAVRLASAGAPAAGHPPPSLPMAGSPQPLTAVGTAAATVPSHAADRHLLLLERLEAACAHLETAAQAALASATAAQLTALRADQRSAGTATSRTAARSVVVAARATLAEAKLDFRVVGAADRVAGAAAGVSVRGAAIAAREGRLPAGATTTALDAALADLARRAAAADAAAGEAVKAVIDLPAAPTLKQVGRAGRIAGTRLGAAHKAEAAAATETARAATLLAALRPGR